MTMFVFIGRDITKICRCCSYAESDMVLQWLFFGHIIGLLIESYVVGFVHKSCAEFCVGIDLHIVSGATDDLAVSVCG